MSAVIPFQITVGGRGGTGYGLRAAAAGRAAEARLDMPALPADPAGMGRALGKALFPPPVRQLLIDVARGADESGARVQLQLTVAPPELAALPWEWATLGGETMWRPAVREDYALMRVGQGTRPRPPLPVAGPLRLLVACAPGPAAAAAAPLGHALAGPVRAGGLVVDLLRDADIFALREALAEEPCHALHLVAADGSGQGQGARLRLGRGVDAAGLAGLLEEYPDLRLLTLAADLGADAGALSSVASTVHDRLGIAVIALGDLDNAQVAAFCGPCYAALAAGDPVDLAATDGRAALEAAGGAWGAPRLWAVPGAERLFTEAPAMTPPLATRRRRPMSEEDANEAALSAPVGRPLRPSRAASALGRTATRALATARAFVVDATAVGEPAQRARPEQPRGSWLRPKVVALIVACLVLVFMVSQVLPEGDAATEALTPTPTLDLFLPTSMPTLDPALGPSAGPALAPTAPGTP